MNKSKIWNYLKYVSLALIAVLAIVLLAQYINIAMLGNKNSNLTNELAITQSELDEKTSLQNNLDKNHDGKADGDYVDKIAKEELGLQKDNEEIIHG